MSKRTVFTTISPLPAGVSREVVIDFLHNHIDMIDLNPLVIERHPIDPPAKADPSEKECVWYSLTDKIDYLPGGKVSGDISYTCVFHDLASGIQTHCRAPLGVDIRDKWTLCGSLPGEPPEPVELGLGAPATGLYIREDVDLRCNILMTSFVKKNLKRSHATLVDKLVEVAKLASAARTNGAGDRRSLPGFTQMTTPPTPPWSPPPPQTLAQTPGPHAANATQNHPRDGSWATRNHAPPQIGSAFVNGYQHSQMPWIPVTSPPQGSTPYRAPPSSQTLRYAQDHTHSQCPPILRAPIQPPRPLGPTSRPYSPPRMTTTATTTTTTLPDPTCYPAPLRIRNLSVSSVQTQSQYVGEGAGEGEGTGTGADASVKSVSSSLTSRKSTSFSSSSHSSEQHPLYPHLSPYSSTEASSSSPDEPLPPPLLVTTGLFGYDGRKGGVSADEEEEEELDHPAVLRPGGMTCRLNGPFIAELE